MTSSQPKKKIHFGTLKPNNPQDQGIPNQGQPPFQPPPPPLPQQGLQQQGVQQPNSVQQNFQNHPQQGFQQQVIQQPNSIAQQNLQNQPQLGFQQQVGQQPNSIVQQSLQNQPQQWLNPSNQQQNIQQFPQPQHSPRYDAPGNQNAPSNNINTTPQVGVPFQNQIQNNFNKAINEQAPLKEENKPENWIKPLPNTPLEERELQFQAKNRLETSKFFKGYVENSKKSSNQSCIIDVPQQILKTKEFFLKQQPLAIQVQEFMEKYLFYQQNQKQASFISFLGKSYVKDDKSVNLTQFVIYQLKNLAQLSTPIELTQQQPNSKEDIMFLQNIKSLAAFLRDSKTLDLLTKSSTYDELSLLSKFVYRYFVMNLECRIQVENSDYYLFQSCGGSPNENILIQLLLQTLMHEEKLSEMISQSEKYQPLDQKKFEFEKIETFILGLQANKTLTIQVLLFFGNPPDTNQKLSDKYSELWDLYEKGCKIQIFKKILEASWPERSFQQGFDQTFTMLTQFQLFIIWLQQMQEKIMDFQFFARACLNSGNLQDSKGQLSTKIPSYIKQFKAELQSLIFRQIANKLYCVAAALTNKDLSKQTDPVFQIFFSKDEQSQLLLGSIVCQKINSSLCFFFRDHKDNLYLKKVCVTFVQGRAGMSAQAICEANFSVDSKDEKKYEFRVFDSKDIITKYSSFGRFYDTILINKLIEKTRYPGDTQKDFDLSELLFPK